MHVPNISKIKAQYNAKLLILKVLQSFARWANTLISSVTDNHINLLRANRVVTEPTIIDSFQVQ